MYPKNCLSFCSLVFVRTRSSTARQKLSCNEGNPAPCLRVQEYALNSISLNTIPYFWFLNSWWGMSQNMNFTIYVCSPTSFGGWEFVASTHEILKGTCKSRRIPWSTVDTLFRFGLTAPKTFDALVLQIRYMLSVELERTRKETLVEF